MFLYFAFIGLIILVHVQHIYSMLEYKCKISQTATTCSGFNEKVLYSTENETENKSWTKPICSLSAAIQLVLGCKVIEPFTRPSMGRFFTVLFSGLFLNPGVWLQQILHPTKKEEGVNRTISQCKNIPSRLLLIILTVYLNRSWRRLCPWWDTMFPPLSPLCTEASWQTLAQNCLSHANLHLVDRWQTIMEGLSTISCSEWSDRVWG